MENNRRRIDREQKGGRDELRSSFSRLLRSIRESLTDLTTLEVNSVLAHNISAVHPRNDDEFLHQTCADLVSWFERRQIDSRVQKPLSNESLTRLNKLKDRGQLTTEDHKDVEALCQEVVACLEHEKDLPDEAQRHQRAEYRRHLRYLQKYTELHRSPHWNWPERMLEGREHHQLRKLWEIVDTAFVYAQTVVGFDGDVVSRINEQLLDNAQRIAKDNAEALMHFHSRNVEAGANYRNNLMDTFVRITRAVLGRL